MSDKYRTGRIQESVAAVGSALPHQQFLRKSYIPEHRQNFGDDELETVELLRRTSFEKVPEIAIQCQE